MGKVKQIEIKNLIIFTMTWSISKNSKLNFLKLDKRHYKCIDIYYIGYITIKEIGDCTNIQCKVDALKKKNGNKHLIFDDSVNENKWLLKKYEDVWDGIKNEIKTWKWW